MVRAGASACPARSSRPIRARREGRGNRAAGRPRHPGALRALVADVPGPRATRASTARSSTPFDDPYVMAGNGTIGLEILEDLPDVDAVVIPWGGGGLACGIAAAIRALRARMRRLRGRGRDRCAARGLRSRPARRAGVDYRPSFVDGIGGKTVFPQMLERAERLDRRCTRRRRWTKSRALRLLAERNHVVAEGAGACPVAARSRVVREGQDRLHRLRRQHRPRPLRVTRRPGPTLGPFFEAPELEHTLLQATYRLLTPRAREAFSNGRPRRRNEKYATGRPGPSCSRSLSLHAGTRDPDALFGHRGQERDRRLRRNLAARRQPLRPGSDLPARPHDGRSQAASASAATRSRCRSRSRR